MSEAELSIRNCFESVEQAKAFLIGKIESVAEEAGAPLNVDEKKALDFTPDDPLTEWGLIWAHVRGAESPDGRDFERQMVEFLQTAFQHDKETGSKDIPRYPSAQEKIATKTNWIVSIARKALDSKGRVA
jgi:hypothetical protein